VSIRRTLVPVLAGALALLGAPPAEAQAPLPPIGAEFPLYLKAWQVPITLDGDDVRLDFAGGARVRVEPDQDDPTRSVRLRMLSLRMTADWPDDAAGSIVIQQDRVDANPKSRLRLTDEVPQPYEQTMVLSFTMRVDGPESRTYELTTNDPAWLVGTPARFPSKGDLYRLRDPVDLVYPENPTDTVALITRFPVWVGGL
jgi:hypothetical protein